MKNCANCGIEVSVYWVNNFKPYCFECYVPEKLNPSFDKLYEFVDFNTTGKAVVINSKGQWRRHLKSLGMHDDCPQGKLRMEDLKRGESRYEKERAHQEKRQTIQRALKEIKSQKKIFVNA